jgi:hypothetical protein
VAAVAAAAAVVAAAVAAVVAVGNPAAASRGSAILRIKWATTRSDCYSLAFVYLHTTIKRPHFDTLFQKTVFFSKIYFGKPPSKFLEVCLYSEYM